MADRRDLRFVIADDHSMIREVRRRLRQRVVERSRFAFREPQPGVDAIRGVPPVVLYRSQARGRSSSGSDGHQEVMEPAKYIEQATTRWKRSRLFQGMNVAPMRPYEALPSAPGDLQTIYRCVTSFYFEFDGLHSKTTRYRLTSDSMKVNLRARSRSCSISKCCIRLHELYLQIEWEGVKT